MDIKQTKKEIRRLKKIKKDLRKGSDESKELRIKIKELKQQLVGVVETSPEKDKLIEEINSLTEAFLVGIIDLRNYDIKQLEHHLSKLKTRRRNDYKSKV